MSQQIANNKDGDILYLTLKKSDDAKVMDIDDDVQMDTNNHENGSNKKHGKRCKRGKKDKHLKRDKHSKDKTKKGGKKCKKDKESKKLEKLQKKIDKLIAITQSKQTYHLNEAQLLGNKVTELQNLANYAPGMEFKDLKRSLVQIIKKSKKEKKFDKRTRNNEKRKDKKQAMLERKQRKMERKKAKLERKKIKIENNKIMENARVESLPLKMEEKECLELYIDGYNIIGCDKMCRKYMRGKARLARGRIIELVHAFYQERNLNIGYQINVHVWFDKNGKDFKYNDVINVVFSGKQSVDDKWVDMFGKCDKAGLGNKLVVTSDRGLTVRLGKLGVKCIKSGVFYKQYLASENNDGKQGNNDDVVNMVVDGEAYEPGNDIETNRMADMDANGNEKQSSSDDDEDEDEDEDDEEYDIIEMELEGFDDSLNIYPTPKY